MTSDVIEAFITTVFLYKIRKMKTSFTQYFSGTVSERDQAAYNWL